MENKSRKKWLESDIDSLESLMAKGKDVMEISKKLGRSTNAIRCRATRLGFHKKYPNADLGKDIRIHIIPKGYPSYVLWRQHPRFKDYYCSSTGLIWSARAGKEMSQYYLAMDKERKKGLWVSITRDGRPGHQTKVSRMIAEAWFKDFSSNLSVMHIDGNRDNNDIANLRLVSKKELGQLTGHMAVAIPIARYNSNNELVRVYRSVRSAAKEIGVSYQTVLDKVNGKLKRASSCKGIDLRYYESLKKRKTVENYDLSYRLYNDIEFNSIDDLKKNKVSLEHTEYLIDKLISDADKSKSSKEELLIDKKLDVLMQYYAML